MSLSPPIIQIDLATLPSDQGFSLNGLQPGDQLGRVVRPAGDVNGDGLADLMIGAAAADPQGRIDAGVVYVVFGSPDLLTVGNLDLTILDGSNGFVIEGAQAGDGAGRAFSSAGDLNGDGYDDLILGGLPTDPTLTESVVWVVYGGSEVGSSGTIDLQTLDGNNGFALVGDVIEGVAVSGAGDLNGDGYDDVMIGIPLADPAGQTDAGITILLFGGPSLGIDGRLDLTTLTVNSGLVITGTNPGDTLGRFVRDAGDLNGDGYGDVVLGAAFADPNGQTNAGLTYVIFGSSDLGQTGPLELTNLDGSQGFMVSGLAAGDLLGRSVGTAGDVNGDGYGDLILGAPGATVNGQAQAGAVYLIFGQSDLGAGGLLSLDSLAEGKGITLTGEAAGDLTGLLVSGAEDVNGDGYDDLIIASPGRDREGVTNVGDSYVVLGGPQLEAITSLDLGNLDGFNGFVITGADQVGDASPWETPIFVSGVGDLNGDGLDDLAIGDSTIDLNGETNLGQGFVVFGNAAFGTNQITGTPQSDWLVGTDQPDRFYADGGSWDVLIPGAGADTIVYPSLQDGVDVILGFQPGVDRLDLTGLVTMLIGPNLNPLEIGLVQVKGWERGPAPVTVVAIDLDGPLGASPVCPLVVLPGVEPSQLTDLSGWPV